MAELSSQKTDDMAGWQSFKYLLSDSLKKKCLTCLSKVQIKSFSD